MDAEGGRVQEVIMIAEEMRDPVPVARRATGLLAVCLALVLWTACGSDPTSPVATVQGDVTVRVQQDLDALRRVRAIEGSLKIQPPPGKRLDLSALGDLQTVGGYCVIDGVVGLENLRDLASLQSVGRDMGIIRNPDLRSLRGLEGLVRFAGLVIRDNDSLIDLQGISACEIQGLLSIEGNAELRSLHGLEHVRTPGRGGAPDLDVVIANNPRLRTLAGLDSLEYVGFLSIARNDSLQDVSPLRSLRKVAETLDIEGSYRVRIEVPAFDQLEECGQLNLDRVTGVFDLADFDRTHFTGIRIQWTDLVSLVGLAPQDSLEVLDLSSNERLADLSGLSGLRKARLLMLEHNPVLRSVAALSGCRVGTLLINNCDLLETLQGLEGTTNVTLGLHIVGNERLSSIDGLRNVTSVDGDASFFANPALCDTVVDAWARSVQIGGTFVDRENRACR